jgi:hypothetical protein
MDPKTPEFLAQSSPTTRVGVLGLEGIEPFDDPTG